MSEESTRAQLKILDFLPFLQRQKAFHRVFYTCGTDYSAKMSDPFGQFIDVRHHM